MAQFERRSPLHIAGRALSQNFVEVPRMQPIRGTNRTHILFCKQFAFLYIFDRQTTNGETFGC